jgi:hypothetical protein
VAFEIIYRPEGMPSGRSVYFKSVSENSRVSAIEFACLKIFKSWSVMAISIRQNLSYFYNESFSRS